MRPPPPRPQSWYVGGDPRLLADNAPVLMTYPLLTALHSIFFPRRLTASGWTPSDPSLCFCRAFFFLALVFSVSDRFPFMMSVRIPAFCSVPSRMPAFRQEELI